jgi:hypothetical protein
MNEPGSKFHCVREVVGDHDAVLEFMTEIEGMKKLGATPLS